MVTSTDEYHSPAQISHKVALAFVNNHDLARNDRGPVRPELLRGRLTGHRLGVSFSESTLFRGF